MNIVQENRIVSLWTGYYEYRCELITVINAFITIVNTIRNVYLSISSIKFLNIHWEKSKTH